MLGSGLIKFFSAILLAVILILTINFIGNKSVTAKDLSKNAVIIAEETEVTVITTTSDNAPSTPETINNQEEIPTPSITDILASADIKKGAKISKKCTACHSFTKESKHKIGPNLWNIVGIQKATKDGYKYSKALTSLGGEWDYNSLSDFLAKPKKYAPGTKMGFAGIKKLEDRVALIAWLREQSDAPINLPSD